MNYKFTQIRRDIVTIIKADPRLDRNAKLIFLALSTEAHGLAYTTIDYKSMKEGWGIEKDMLRSAISTLERVGYLINGDYEHNRTKEKSVAKYIGKNADGELIPMGHRSSGDIASDQPDLLGYREDVVTPKEIGDIPVIDFYSPAIVSDIPTQVAAIPKLTSDIQYPDTAIPTQVAAIPNADADIPTVVSDIPTQVAAIPKLRRKEEEKDRRRENENLSSSLSPTAIRKRGVTVDALKASLKSIYPNHWISKAEKYDHRDESKILTYLDMIDGDVDVFEKAIVLAKIGKDEYMSNVDGRIQSQIREMKTQKIEGKIDVDIMTMT